MMRKRSRRRELVVSFCDGRGSVCDARCRQDAILERAREQVVRHRLGAL